MCRTSRGSFVLTLLALLAIVIGGVAPVAARQDIATPVGTPASTEAVASWTNFKGDAGRTGVADAGPTGQPVQLWRVQAGGSCYHTPAIVAGIVYTPCSDGVLYALDAATGQERWRYDGTELGELSASGTLVYVKDADVLHALDATTGQERWQAEVPGGTSAVVDDGLLVIGTSDGYLLGLDAATGSERWRFQVATRGAAHNPALADGIAYAGGDEPGFFAVDADDGTLLWRGDTGNDRTGTAVVAEGIAYIGGGAGANEGHLYAFDARSGDLLWRRDEPIYTPTVLAGTGYSGSASGMVSSFDTATGAEHWQIELGPDVRNVAIANGVLYAMSDADMAVYALDPATGTLLWEFAVDGNIDGGISVNGGVLFVATTPGSIYAIGGSDQGATPVSSPATSPLPATPAAAIENPAEFLWASGPVGFAVWVGIHPDGTLWIPDVENSVIHILSPDDGTLIEEWTDGGAGDGMMTTMAEAPIGGVVFTEDGGFYAGYVNGVIQQFDVDRQFVRAWGGFGTEEGQIVEISGLALDAEGNVYVCDPGQGAILKFTAEGDYLITIGEQGTGPEQLAGPTSPAFDADGNIYVADFINNRIVKFSPDGTFLASWGTRGSQTGQVASPNRVEVDGAGYIYIADDGNHRVQVWDADGQFVAAWGEMGAADGQFTGAGNVQLDGQGNIYVNDIGNQRVQKFELLPPLGGQ